jgi:hypothetical protein
MSVTSVRMKYASTAERMVYVYWPRMIIARGGVRGMRL